MVTNKILEIHAKWLKDNGFDKEAEECFKQAKESKNQDWRQVNKNKSTNKVKK